VAGPRTVTNINGGVDGASDPNTGVLFDIDAIRAEIENSAKEEQITKNLDKLTLDVKKSSTLSPGEGLRHSKSFNDRHTEKKDDYSRRGYGSFELDDEHRSEIRMEFEKDGSRPTMDKIPSMPQSYGGYGSVGGGGMGIGGYGSVGGNDRNVWADYDDYDDEFAPKADDGELKMTFA
jgi:hypothetical protein